jgi:hypothetical protein
MEGYSGTSQGMALNSLHPVRCAKDDLLQGGVVRIWLRAVGYAHCVDDLGNLEISRRSGDGFFQPDGLGESLGAFLGLLGSHRSPVHCGLRSVRIFPEEMKPTASGT